jgi:DNA-binding FadR family transcriptional regulator
MNGPHVVHHNRATGGSTVRERARNRVAALLDFVEQRMSEPGCSGTSKLPTERELAARFGIARNTVRKSLESLVAQGKIVRAVGRGTFADDGKARLEDLPGGEEQGLIRSIWRASPADIMEVRLLIEPPAMELAATKASPADLASAEQCLRRGESSATVAEFERWDAMLHYAILRAVRNQLLTDLYAVLNSLRRQAQWGKLKQRTLTPARLRTYREQHRQIVAALRNRDPEAVREAAREHLLAVRAALVGF